MNTKAKASLRRQMSTGALESSTRTKFFSKSQSSSIQGGMSTIEEKEGPSLSPPKFGRFYSTPGQPDRTMSVPASEVNEWRASAAQVGRLILKRFYSGDSLDTISDLLPSPRVTKISVNVRGIWSGVIDISANAKVSDLRIAISNASGLEEGEFRILSRGKYVNMFALLMSHF